MTLTRAALQALLLAFPLIPGCARHTMSGDAGSRPDRDTPVSVEVENHNWSDMVIYLDRGNLSQRLGTVTAQNSAVFTFPYLQLGTTGNARLRADPIGDLRSFSSETLNVQPGQTIKWTIENDIDRSFLGVY
ncbi:MAG: hypothetical protein ACREL3_02470 [Gemmatimonadales bacterium]